MSAERPTPADLGYREEYSHLRLCGTCFHLYEEGRPDGQNQQCECQPHSSDERWKGFDYNERAALCLCCATVLLPSGSKWSPYFCRECQIMAVGASAWVERLVVPIGRHTLMHSWASGFDPSEPGSVDSVWNTMQTVVKTTKVIMQWYVLRMHQLEETLKLEPGIPVHDFLKRVGDAGLACLSVREETFRGIGELIRSSYREEQEGRPN